MYYSIYCSDPFHDAFKDNEGIGVSQEGFVHIRIQQRNGRKTVTTVQGIGDEYDKRKIVKVCKKVGLTVNALSVCLEQNFGEPKQIVRSTVGSVLFLLTPFAQVPSL